LHPELGRFLQGSHSFELELFLLAKKQRWDLADGLRRAKQGNAKNLFLAGFNSSPPDNAMLMMSGRNGQYKKSKRLPVSQFGDFSIQ
jgi:hypothetical protein